MMTITVLVRTKREYRAVQDKLAAASLVQPVHHGIEKPRHEIRFHGHLDLVAEEPLGLEQVETLAPKSPEIAARRGARVRLLKRGEPDRFYTLSKQRYAT